MSDDFCLLLRVRYCECDAQQVVFNARYGDYVDIAMTEFMRELFGGYAQMLKDNIDNQVVRYAIDWKSPAQFDDVLAIAVSTLKVGNSSFTLQLQFNNHADGREVARAEITYVLVSADDYQKMPVPDNMREKLMHGAPGVVVDHAGASDSV